MSYLGPTLRRPKSQLRPWQRVAIAAVLSLALNVAVMTQMHVDFIGKPAPQRQVTLAPLTAAQWDANRMIAGLSHAPSALRSPLALAPAPVPQKPTPNDPARPNGQVVDVAPSKDHTPPKDAKYVSDQDNTVDKETRSRFAKAGYANTLAKPSEPKAPSTQTRSGGQGGDEGTVKLGEADKALKSGAPKQERLAMNIPSQAARERLDLPDENGDVALQRARQGIQGNGAKLDLQMAPNASADGQGGGAAMGKRGPRNALNLMPSAATFDRLAGGPAPDHLDGVDEGDGTYLNTREWKYATFFNRVKQAVAQAWDPNSVLSVRDPNGQMYAYKDRITVLDVTLDERGSLKGAMVQKSCGVDFLDDTAIDAFKHAQPFVNPPKGLADGSGEIRFTFGFYLDTGGGGLRLFRAPSAGQ